MSVPHVLLGLLEQQPRHGYDLKRAYDARFAGDRPLRYGQVYATLSRLQRDGRVAVAGTEVAGGPERTTYTITPAGVSAFEAWLDRSESPEPYLQPVLFSKVVLALVSGRPAAEVLDRQRSSHLTVMRDLTARKRDAPLTEALAADFALFHLEADLRWIEHAAGRLTRLAEEVAP